MGLVGCFGADSQVELGPNYEHCLGTPVYVMHLRRADGLLLALVTTPLRCDALAGDRAPIDSTV